MSMTIVYFSPPPLPHTHRHTHAHPHVPLMSWDVCVRCMSVIWNAVLCVIGIGTLDFLDIELYDTHVLKLRGVNHSMCYCIWLFGFII